MRYRSVRTCGCDADQPSADVPAVVQHDSHLAFGQRPHDALVCPRYPVRESPGPEPRTRRPAGAGEPGQLDQPRAVGEAVLDQGRHAQQLADLSTLPLWQLQGVRSVPGETALASRLGCAGEFDVDQDTVMVGAGHSYGASHQHGGSPGNQYMIQAHNG